ncbi:hypothetical protein KR215_004205 [Drosophila sulfurigaster]|nr:hypothetical protein KR215_004205 [Drosophila sulfurigaster]
MNTRFQDYESNILYAESTILDPRFKGRVFKCEEAYKKAIHDFHSATALNKSVRIDNACQVKPNENDDIWKDYDNAFQKVSKPSNSTAAAIRKLDKYLGEEYIITDDPLVWWDQRKTQYSPLYTFMLKRLCIVATSMPCERIFAGAGETVGNRRSLLKSSNVENLMFLHTNF